MYLDCSLVSEQNNRIPYLTYLSDINWDLIKPYFPNPDTNKGRKRVHSYREILNAIFYLLRSGCSWRMLPHEFPYWKTVIIISVFGGLMELGNE
jgi:putative transposase